MVWKLLGNWAVRGCEGRVGRAGMLRWGLCARRRAWGPLEAPPRVQEVEAEAGVPVRRGKCGLTFSPGWPFPPCGGHMQHGVQGRDREGEKKERMRERHIHKNSC